MLQRSYTMFKLGLHCFNQIATIKDKKAFDSEIKGSILFVTKILFCEGKKEFNSPFGTVSC